MGRRKSGLERIVGGLATGAVFYGLWYFHVLPLPVGWIVLLGVVFVVLPVLTGLRHLAREIAKDRRGIVTPALVVLHSDLQPAEAEKVLGDLAVRGYAEMRIKDNGTIDYVFHDLT